jgi:hypothetical protein
MNWNGRPVDGQSRTWRCQGGGRAVSIFFAESRPPLASLIAVNMLLELFSPLVSRIAAGGRGKVGLR